MAANDENRAANDQNMAANDQNDTARARTLFVFRAGARLFAVFAEEVEATARELTPSPLPFAPPAVLGVISLRGRVRTVIDPLRLADIDPLRLADRASATADGARADSARRGNPPRLFVALAGDEQLALACDSTEESFDVSPSSVAPPHDPRSPLRGTVERAGETVALIDTTRLFDAATRGTERRRRRS